MRNFPSGGLLLDIGGGNGFVAHALQEAGQEAGLLEPGRQGALNARSRGLALVINSTLEDAGLKDHSLPAAGLFDVLEHVHDDIGFLRVLKRALLPTGRLFLTVPAGPLLWSIDDEYAGHYRRYTASSLKEALRKGGFEVEFATRIFAPLPLPLLFMRVIPWRLGIRKTVQLDQEKQRHGAPRGTFGSLLDQAFGVELSLLQRGCPIPFGSSHLVVARPE